MRSLVIFLTSLALHVPTMAQLSKFAYTPKLRDLHTVYTYEKSNWDGSNAHFIALYIAAPDRIESFTWREGEEGATLVTATMNWENFSVQQFENWEVIGNKRKLKAYLYAKEDPQKISYEIIDKATGTLEIPSFPWHSYDFDFASLSFCWRFLKEKDEDFTFHIADAVAKDDRLAFANKGEVLAHFYAEEWLDGKWMKMYELEGEGLENQGGFVWIDPTTWMIDQYKIKLPDEPGYINGKLHLVTTERMTPQDWKKFVRKQSKP